MRTLRSLLVSMQRLLERARHHVALGALTAALGFLGVVTPGCETDDPGRTLYGPPSVNDTANDTVDASADVPSDVAYPDAVYYGPPPADVQVDQPQVYYGPQPVDVVNDTPVPDGVQPDQPMVYYGPPPTDVVQDQVPDKIEPEVAPLYGVQPADVVEDAVPDKIEPEIVPLYGVQPVDIVNDVPPSDAAVDCGAMMLYGPPPCTSDDDCKEWRQDANWYCDKSDPCFAVCKPKG